MKEENRIRLMTWAIVVLAVLNISTIVTIIYHRHTSSPETNLKGSGEIASESSSVRFSGRWFRDELDLSPEQMNRFREFKNFSTRIYTIFLPVVVNEYHRISVCPEQGDIIVDIGHCALPLSIRDHRQKGVLNIDHQQCRFNRGNRRLTL